MPRVRWRPMRWRASGGDTAEPAESGVPEEPKDLPAEPWRLPRALSTSPLLQPPVAAVPALSPSPPSTAPGLPGSAGDPAMDADVRRPLLAPGEQPGGTPTSVPLRQSLAIVSAPMRLVLLLLSTLPTSSALLRDKRRAVSGTGGRGDGGGTGEVRRDKEVLTDARGVLHPSSEATSKEQHTGSSGLRAAPARALEYPAPRAGKKKTKCIGLPAHSNQQRLLECFSLATPAHCASKACACEGSKRIPMYLDDASPTEGVFRPACDAHGRCCACG